MNRQQILSLIRRPGMINARSLQAVEQLLRRYPYFQGARLLAAQGKHKMRRPDARKNINLAALYATDRGLFKHFMSRASQSVAVRPPGQYSPTMNPISVKKPTLTPIPEGPPRYVAETLSDTARDKLVSEVMDELESLRRNMNHYVHEEENRERREKEAERIQSAAREAQERREKEVKQIQKAEAEAAQAATSAQAAAAVAKEAAEAEQTSKQAIEAQLQELLEAEKKKLAEEAAQLATEKAQLASEQATLKEAEKRKLAEEALRLASERGRLEEMNKNKGLASKTKSTTPTQPRHSAVHSSSPVQVIFGSHPQQGQPTYSPYTGHSPYGTPHYSFFSGYPGYPFVAPMQTYPLPMPHPYGSPFPPMPHMPAPIQSSYAAQPAAQASSPASSSQTQTEQPTSDANAERPPTFQPPVVPDLGNAPSHAEQQEMIDQFMKTMPNADLASPEPSATNSETPPRDPLAHSEEINDDICSEELANLYLNQGHNARAIEIYHRLCEKYPEKSAYFVNKIREIEKSKK